MSDPAAFRVLIADDLSPRAVEIFQRSPGVQADVKVGLKPAELLAIIAERTTRAS